MLTATGMAFRGLVFAGLLATVACGAPRNHDISAAQDEKKTENGWLGVMITNVPRDIAEDLKVSEDGAYVDNVVEDSPAEKAGLKKKDIITEFGSRSIFDADDLAKAVKRTGPGTSVKIGILRSGEKKSLSVTIGEMPKKKRTAMAWSGRGPGMMFFSSSAEGLTLMELNEQLAEYFGAPKKEGVLVQEVESESAADKAGFKAGDVILKVGDRTIDEIRDVTRELDQYDEGEKVPFEILRRGSAKMLTLEIEEGEDHWGFHVFPNPRSEIKIRRIPHIEGSIELDDMEHELRQFHIRLEDKEKELNELLLQVKPKIEGVRTRLVSIKVI